MPRQGVSRNHGHLCGFSAHWREMFDTSFKRPKSFVFVVFCLAGIVKEEKDSDRYKEWKRIRASKKICLSLRNLFVDGVMVLIWAITMKALLCVVVLCSGPSYEFSIHSVSLMLSLQYRIAVLIFHSRFWRGTNKSLQLRGESVFAQCSQITAWSLWVNCSKIWSLSLLVPHRCPTVSSRLNIWLYQQ